MMFLVVGLSITTDGQPRAREEKKCFVVRFTKCVFIFFALLFQAVYQQW